MQYPDNQKSIVLDEKNNAVMLEPGTYLISYGVHAISNCTTVPEVSLYNNDIIMENTTKRGMANGSGCVNGEHLFKIDRPISLKMLTTMDNDVTYHDVYMILKKLA